MNIRRNVFISRKKGCVIMSVLRKAVKFTNYTSYYDIPREVLEIGKRAIIDYIGVTLAGSKENVSKILQDYAGWASAHPEARVIGTDKKVAANLATLVNRTSGHALDYDDVSWTTIGHPTVAVCPAAFAAGEIVKASGKEVLRAYIMGIEIMYKIAARLMPATSNNGWHTTSVFGTLGAAMSSALVLRLNENQCTSALAIAASQSSGIRANFGTMTKAYHAGMAAFNGYNAALLASRGLTGSDTAIESQDGFAKTFSGDYINDYCYDFGNPWDLLKPGIVFKRYPCCSGTHPAIDCMLDILKENAVEVSQIDSIRVGVSLLGPRELVCHSPKNPTETKFSMEYAIAAAIIFGKVALEEFTEESIHDPRIEALIPKINMEVDSELAKLGFIGTAPVKIRIILKNGSELNRECDLAKGDPEKPLNDREIENKFMQCASRIINEKKSKKILDSLFELETIDDINSITDLLY